MIREQLPHFYPRQDVADVDLNQVFAYDDDAWRAHNRAFHGCGVVCGLAVTLSADQKWAEVTPGYALSPQGDEIYVPEPARVPVDCTGLIEVDCEDLSGQEPSSEFEPAYIILRHTTRPARQRLLAPAACADRECAPTRVCNNFELVCTTRRPEACPTRFDVSSCCSPAAIRRLLAAGDLATTGLFGCADPGGEDAIILAGVDFRRGENKRIVPGLNFSERAYVPVTQFLLHLAQRAGAQAARSQARRAAITSLGQPGQTRLQIPKGVTITGLAVRGRELGDIVKVELTGPAAAFAIVWTTDPTGEVPLRINKLAVPLSAHTGETGLKVTLSSGLVISSQTQARPVVIEIVNTRVQDIPLRFIAGPSLGAWAMYNLSRSGYTAQYVAMESPENIRQASGGVLNLDQAIELKIQTQAWLQAGALRG